MYTVYVIKSETTGKHYTGYTGNITGRLEHHNKGRNTSTRYGIPWKIIHTEEFSTKKDAWLREHKIKSYKGGNAFKKLIE